MPVSFRRLRISGFKSFAEPTSVEIMPGLTGIVGPNGCGKSNVIEALRWAMGESSARSLRGGEMEDVIFAGTAGRASRNIAEVTLVLDETTGRAPPPFHEQPELEILRRIERGSGSAYRINGREVRARDVQTLFADLASGARASAMVSQGRVGALVGAKPEDRRAVLEEAANITGLHARRHEAELKLRAAEANMARAEDLRAQLELQLNGLQRQARQASRYRNISVAIRTAESELLALQRARVEHARAAAAAALHDAELAVAAATEAATAATTQATEAAATLPPLREQEADHRTRLERHRVAQEQIAAEAQRAGAELAEAQRRVGQIHQDLTHAQQLRHDATAADQRLAAEEIGLVQADAGHDARSEAAEAAAGAAADAVQVAEAEANRATEAAAEANARAQAAAQLLAQAEQRAKRLNDQFQTASQDRARIAAEQVDPAAIARATEAAAQAEAAVTAARQAVEQAEQARSAAAAALAAAREAHTTADSSRARLAAESQALSEILAVKDSERWPPMLDKLTVADGLEAALGAVLGEELTSALNPGAPRHWRELPPFDPAPALPARATALTRFVQGPPALARALSQIGVVETEQDGTDHQTVLLPGQSLVSRSGAVWRWDGYTIQAGTPTQAAVRLRQRNRLAGLRARLTVAEQDAATARTARTAAETTAHAAAAAEQQARATRRDREQAVERGRAGLAALRAQAATATAKMAAADDQLARTTLERDEALIALAQAREANSALPDIAALRDAVNAARANLLIERARENCARSERDLLARDHAARVNRRRTIVAERAGWSERARDAAGRVTDLAARQTDAADTLKALEARPSEIALRRTEALDALGAAETAHRQAAETLSVTLTHASGADRAARAAEAALAGRREDAVRTEGGLQQASHAWGVVAERILERLGANPALPDPPADLSQDNEDRARKRLERQLKEREEMGPVNLRADQEATAVETRIGGLETERAELTAAIAKLRGSIGHLNREGRERLAAVFQQIDRNFQQLFTRMFGGGRAHLALVGSDDPLEAGLEIYAQPPGKKLATLSLLSGGEQALTALSLIFAVFRCNPAPVCVLDEVDAPLDDANVERFCTLLEDMVRETGTRFLVVTHHPLTMARMDRLYGVTMQERGVSRLLSVDLVAAAGMIDPPRMAAE
ncbi:chromosome segregation SMC family protein [Rhodopila sp.]|uniref:chromosome segregation SMC family protein n=1 Tax=Rhodopila sp. TaxID=2480087 RepID=UPI003D0962E0